VHQVSLVESQVAALTAVEMERRKLEMSEQVKELSEKRVALSILLMDLLSQQAERR
jgi:E3 ubiquitin-protein ligase LRSAM1